MPPDQFQNNYKEMFLESKEKFDSIFSLTSAASKIIAPDLTILKVNHALTELLGFSAQEIEGTRILDYACPEYVHHWQDLQKAMWEDHQPFFKLEGCLFKKDKTIAWVQVTTVLFHEKGNSYAFTVLDDITWRKYFEQSEKRLTMALQYSNLAVWEMNLDDFSVNRSNSHDVLFGFENHQEHWNLKTYLRLLLPEDAARLETQLYDLPKEGLLDFKGRVCTINGEIKWFQFQGKREQERQGQGKILGTIKDITKEKTAERHKDEFISTVSHELKTPITSIKAQTQILERRFAATQDQATALMLRRINLQINRLNLLIKDLLEVGRLDEQKLPIHTEAFLFNDMVEDIVAETQRTTSSHKLIIEHNPEVYCTGDRGRASQVLGNLLTNAIKYSPGKDKVIIGINEKQGQLICSVQDFGIGIAAEKQAHIFERFYRAAGIQGHLISGFGLGLYISAELIKKMEGKIWLNSVLGKGATFYFSIPCQ
ncbi:MAG: PAS domain-containing sensor histidine kinase [Janthinobacterium lividum]